MDCLTQMMKALQSFRMLGISTHWYSISSLKTWIFSSKMLCSLQHSRWWMESRSLVIPSSRKGSGSIIVDWLCILTFNYHEVYGYGIVHDFYSRISVNFYQITLCDNCDNSVRILHDWGFMSSGVWHYHWVSGLRYFEESQCLLIQSHAIEEEWLLDLENEGTKIL
jgi:hypothetical protein